MRAFVLSGGGPLGAWQVGQLDALFEAGIRPDLLVGTSVGAINAAAIAGNPTSEGVERLVEVWRRVRREDVLPGWGWSRARALARKSLYPNAGLRSLIERGVQYRLIDEAALPLLIVTASIDAGEERVLSSGPVIDAVLASAAIPGVYPAVTWNGERLVDGGIVDMIPVRPAVAAGADEVYVLAATAGCPPNQRMDHLHDVLMFSLGLLMRPSTDMLAACYGGSARVEVLPSSVPFEVGPFDFSKTGLLIEEGHAQTAAFVRSVGRPTFSEPVSASRRSGKY
jgi:NTE family protein